MRSNEDWRDRGFQTLMVRSFSSIVPEWSDNKTGGQNGLVVKKVQAVERLYCKRPFQCLASSKILTPYPPPPGECVPPPPLVRGRTHSLCGEGCEGSIFCKTPNTALYSTYVSTLWSKHSHVRRFNFGQKAGSLRYESVRWRFSACLKCIKVLSSLNIQRKLSIIAISWKYTNKLKKIWQQTLLLLEGRNSFMRISWTREIPKKAKHILSSDSPDQDCQDFRSFCKYLLKFMRFLSYVAELSAMLATLLSTCIPDLSRACRTGGCRFSWFFWWRPSAG